MGRTSSLAAVPIFTESTAEPAFGIIKAIQFLCRLLVPKPVASGALQGVSPLGNVRLDQ